MEIFNRTDRQTGRGTWKTTGRRGSMHRQRDGDRDMEGSGKIGEQRDREGDRKTGKQRDKKRQGDKDAGT